MALTLDHFDALERLLALEQTAEQKRLEQQREGATLKQLEALGLALLDVECSENSTGLGGRALLTFALSGGGRLSVRFSVGDVVTVAPRKAEVEAPPWGIVTRSFAKELQVAFDRQPPEWAQEGRLRLDLRANSVTFDRARAALSFWKSQERGVARTRRDVLLGVTPPRTDTPREFEPSRALNDEQKAAVSRALASRDFFLVHGPPGTGKSTVLAELAAQLARKGERLLCTAASNAAVDHLLELCLEVGIEAVRVGHPARVLPKLQAHTLDLLVEKHPDRIAAREMFDEAFDLLGYARKQRTRGRSRERFANAREAQTEGRRLIGDARRLERQAVAAVLSRAQAICVTLSSLDSYALEGQSFDTALFDEATQAIEPSSLIAFSRVQRVMMAGDPMQLPATVLSTEAAQKGLAVSLFERLHKTAPEATQLLKEQYRMNVEIMSLPSERMYAGALRAHPSVAHRTLAELLDKPLEALPLMFLDTAGKGFDEHRAEGTESLLNEGEAQLLTTWARALLAAGLSAEQMAVITPYRAQADALRSALADVAELEVDTVDAFQGREKEAVLVSLVRSNAEQSLGFLLDLRRLNVALTRAKRHLFVVGDSATLSSEPFYAALVERAQALGGYRSAWEWGMD